MNKHDGVSQQALEGPRKQGPGVGIAGKGEEKCIPVFKVGLQDAKFDLNLSLDVVAGRSGGAVSRRD